MAALLGAGCGSGTGSTAGSNPDSSVGNIAGNGGSSGCLNSYYPLKAGSSIKYQMTGGSVDTPITIKVAEATATSAKLEYSFLVKGQEQSVTNEISCANGEISAKGYLDFASRLTGLDISYETDSMEGDIIPNDLSVGKEWTQTTKVTMHSSDPRFKAVIDGKHQTTVTHSKVLGEEQVTVPAGTFTAKKVQQDIQISGEVTGASTITTHTTSWFVKDVGLVKSETNTNGAISGMQAVEINH